MRKYYEEYLVVKYLYFIDKQICYLRDFLLIGNTNLATEKTHSENIKSVTHNTKLVDSTFVSSQGREV